MSRERKKEDEGVSNELWLNKRECNSVVLLWVSSSEVECEREGALGEVGGEELPVLGYRTRLTKIDPMRATAPTKFALRVSRCFRNDATCF